MFSQNLILQEVFQTATQIKRMEFNGAFCEKNQTFKEVAVTQLVFLDRERHCESNLP